MKLQARNTSHSTIASESLPAGKRSPQELNQLSARTQELTAFAMAPLYGTKLPASIAIFRPFEPTASIVFTSFVLLFAVFVWTDIQLRLRNSNSGAPQLNTPSTRLRALRVAAIAGCLMCLLAIAKTSLFPTIQIWVSHLATILFTTVTAGVIGAVILTRDRWIRSQVTETERRYRDLFERSQAGAYLAALDGLILDCNMSFCSTLGYSAREELIGRSIDEVFQDAAEKDRFLAKVKTARTVTNLEQSLRKKDGGAIWVLHSASLVTDDNDAGKALRGTIADLTEQRAREQFEQRLAAIVRSSDYAIFSLSKDGIVESWNSGAERLFGYRAEEIVGQSVRILVPAEKLSECVEILEKVQSGSDVEIETIRMDRSGRRFDVALSVSAISDTTGSVTGIAAIIRNISDRKEAERALQQSEIQYRLVFDRNPMPMWVFDRHSLRFLAVNRAAVRQYGFTEEEFLQMDILQIRPDQYADEVRQDVAKRHKGLQRPGLWQHRRKDGSILEVEVVCHELEFQGNDAMLVAAYDVTERNKAQEAQRAAEERYRSIFENAVVGIFQATPDGRPIQVNRALAGMHGYASPEEFLSEISDIATQLFVDPERMTELGAALDQGTVRGAEIEVYRKDRSRAWVRVHLRAVRDALGVSKRVEGVVEDIGERKQAQEALLFKTALLEAQSESTIDGILVVDDSSRIVLANQQFRLLFSVPQELLDAGDAIEVRKFLTDLAEDPEAFRDKVQHLYEHIDERSRDEVCLKDGRTFDRYSAPLIDSRCHHRGRIWYFREITEQKHSAAQIEFLAYRDDLTGLPNRNLFRDRVETALTSARKRAEGAAMFFVDLDRFNMINDSLGRPLGDLMLIDVGERLKANIRDEDILARSGGDEFFLLLRGIEGPAEATAAAQRIMATVEQEFRFHEHSIAATCCVGISLFPDHGLDAETLMKNADAALYCAKAQGSGQLQIFSEAIRDKSVEQLALESDLRGALERKELFLVYQPQIDLISQRVVGMEALIRWRHPELGIVSPDRFIPLAEGNGMIVAIGEWVLKTACAQLRDWLNEGLVAVPVAVNVSAVQFRNENFASVIRRVLQETGVAPDMLELELTESLLMANADVTSSVITDLLQIGLKLAIDDFGTGYSSFSYLKQFRVSKLKIDRSFIRDIPEDKDDAAISTAIINMAKSLNLKVIAEGVENQAQLEFLQRNGCDEAQGFFYSKPIPADEIALQLESVPVRIKR